MNNLGEHSQSYGKTPKGDWRFNRVTPAGVIYNLIMRYTKPGDLVVVPMCGSGTIIDVCKEEGRRVIGYDIIPTRPDIIQNDAGKIPLPDNSVDNVTGGEVSQTVMLKLRKALSGLKMILTQRKVMPIFRCLI